MLNYNKLIFKSSTILLILKFLDVSFALLLIVERALEGLKYFEDVLKLFPSMITVNSFRFKLFNLFYNSFCNLTHIYTNALNYITYLKYYLLSTSSIVLLIRNMFRSDILRYFTIIKSLLPICIANLFAKVLLINYKIVTRDADLNYYMQAEDVWIPEDLYLKMNKIVSYRSMVTDGNRQSILNVLDTHKPWQVRYILSTLLYDKVIYNSWPNGFYLCDMYIMYVNTLLNNNIEKYLERIKNYFKK